MSIGMALLLFGVINGLYFAPPDYQQSDAFRIIYVHVPAAWISLGIFSSLALLSVGTFVFKNKNFALISKSIPMILTKRIGRYLTEKRLK